MKTQQGARKSERYTLTAREVVFAPETNVTVAFMGGLTYSGELQGLRDWVIKEGVNAPLSCYVDGKRHGIYACIKATDQRVAAGLSVLCGSHIQEGCGATFATRSQMREVARALNLAGISVTRDNCNWGITDQPFAEDFSKPVSRQQHLELTRAKMPTEEEQFADSPFA